MSGRKKRRGRSDAVDELMPAAAMPEQTVPRRLRIESDLQQHLAAALKMLEDPRVKHAVLTRVVVTDDLQLAKVFVRPGIGSKTTGQVLVQVLTRACGRLRRDIASALALRRVPQLRFMTDEGPEAAQRVEALLAEIRQEQPTDDASDPTDDASDPTDDASDSVGDTSD